MKIIKIVSCIILISIFSILSAPGCNTDEQQQSLITILHVNDTHAHLDDIARYAYEVEQIRNDTGDNNVLLFHSGDVFAGTPYYSVYHGQADLWFMDYLKYDAMCLGNHEFDNGTAPVVDFIKNAEFPVLCANFDFTDIESLANTVKPCITIDRNGIKYGIFGLTTEETGVIASPGPGIIINNHIEAAKKVVDYLKSKQINRIIALTHLGWDVDMELAKTVEGIDIIIGGHSHTVPDQYPTAVTEDNTPTLVVQAGCFDGYLGQINAVFNKEGVIQSWDGSRLITIDEKIPENSICTAKLDKYREPLQKYMNEVIGKTLVDLDGEREHIRTCETNLGDLVADAMLDKARSVNAQIAIFNGGAVRTSIAAGDISLWNVMEVLPFNNYLECVDLTGEQVIAALENGLSQVEQVKGRFPQVAGLRFQWDSSEPPGKRVKKVEVTSPAGYEEIKPETVYRIATNDYMVQGGDDYIMMKNGENINNLGFMLYEVVAEYIKSNSPLNIATDNRIIEIEIK